MAHADGMQGLPAADANSQMWRRFERLLKDYGESQCALAVRWGKESESTFGAFRDWLPQQNPREVLAMVVNTIAGPIGETGKPLSTERGAEIMVQMAWLALVQVVTHKHQTELHSMPGAASPLRLPLLDDVILALVVACRLGVSVELGICHDSSGRECLVVKKLITHREIAEAGHKGKVESLDAERRRELTYKMVLDSVVPPASALRTYVPEDDDIKAFVNLARRKGDCLPIVVLDWDEGDLAQDIGRDLAVTTVLRGDPLSAPPEHRHRNEAALLSIDPRPLLGFLEDIKHLLRTSPIQPAPPAPVRPVVFISYAHEDRELMLRVQKFLNQFTSVIQPFSDTELQAGDRWQETLDKHLAQCRFAVLLVSVDFVNSEFINTVEMPEFARRHTAGDLQIVPIAADHCDHKHFVWLTGVQWAVPHDQPLSDLAANQPAKLTATLNKIATDIAHKAQQLAAQDRRP